MAAKKRGGVRGSRSKSSHHRRTPDDTMWRAWKLYRAGMTYRDIGRIIECDPSCAWKLVDRARKAIAEVHGAELKQEIHERERALVAAHWPTRKHPDSAKVIQASDKLLIAMFGLEAPKRTEITGKDGAPLQIQDVTALTDEQLLAIARGGDPDDQPAASGESGAGASSSSGAQAAPAPDDGLED